MSIEVCSKEVAKLEIATLCLIFVKYSRFWKALRTTKIASFMIFFLINILFIRILPDSGVPLSLLFAPLGMPYLCNVLKNKTNENKRYRNHKNKMLWL